MTRPRFIPPLSSDTAPRTLRALGRPGILLLAVGAAAMPACVEDGEYRVVGSLAYEPEIPDTVTASVPVTMTFKTSGGGCHRGGDTEASVDGRSAVVIPYDFVMDWDVCELILQYFEHKATVVFDEPGTAQIVLRHSAGRKVYPVEVAPAG